MSAFVSVTKHNGKAVVDIKFHVHSTRFPLTKKGCIEAGRYLYRFGCESWSNSSSVDFPREVKKGFRYNVHDLMLQGFNELIPVDIVKSERVGQYEIRGNQYIAIAINVTNPKDAHYFDIDPDVNNDAFIRACGWAYEPEN